MFEHHVGENEHFAHGGHNGDLRRLPLIAQMLVIWLDLGITPDGYDSCHVENTAHRYPSARDVRLSTHEAAIPVHGRNTNESCDLFLADAAEFGKFGDKSCGGNGTDARDSSQEGGSASKLVIVLDLLGDREIELVDLLGEEGQMVID